MASCSPPFTLTLVVDPASIKLLQAQELSICVARRVNGGVDLMAVMAAIPAPAIIPTNIIMWTDDFSLFSLPDIVKEGGTVPPLVAPTSCTLRSAWNFTGGSFSENPDIDVDQDGRVVVRNQNGEGIVSLGLGLKVNGMDVGLTAVPSFNGHQLTFDVTNKVYVFTAKNVVGELLQKANFGEKEDVLTLEYFQTQTKTAVYVGTAFVEQSV